MEQQCQSESGIYENAGIFCDVCYKIKDSWRIILVCSIMITFVLYVLCVLFLKTVIKDRMDFFVGVGVVLIIIPLASFAIYGVVKFLRKRESMVIPWNVQQQHMQHSGEISSSDSTQGESNKENKTNNRNAHDYYDSIPSSEISKHHSRRSRKESEHHSRNFEAETSQEDSFRYPLSDTHVKYSPERHRKRNFFTRSTSSATKIRYDLDSEGNGRISETCPKSGIENRRYVLEIKRHPETNGQETSKAVKRHLRSKSETTDNRSKSAARKWDVAGNNLTMKHTEIGQENCCNTEPLQQRSRNRSEPRECLSRRKTGDDFSPDVPTSYVPRNYTRKVQHASQSWQPSSLNTRNSLSNTEIIQYLSPGLEKTDHVKENEQMPHASSNRQGTEYVPTREMEHPRANTRINEYMQRNNRRTLGELDNQNHKPRDEQMSYTSTSRETLGYESPYSSDTVICSSGYGTEDNRYEGCSMRQCPPTRSAEGLHLRLSNKYLNGRQLVDCSARNGDYRPDIEHQGREYHQRMPGKTRLITGHPSNNMGHAIVQPMLENIKALNYPFHGYLPEQYTFVRKENARNLEDFEHLPKRIPQADKVTRTQTSECSPTKSASTFVIV